MRYEMMSKFMNKFRQKKTPQYKMPKSHKTDNFQGFC